MKYGFNNTNIITGYIKELLRDFNLPTCKIYDPDRYVGTCLDVYEQRAIPLDIDRPYLYQNYFYIATSKGLKKLNNFELGNSYDNITKNLVIKSNYYDQYTHEYLGEYLRFIRDYQGINLMPLYNCYSGFWTNSVKKYFIKASIRQQYNLSENGEFIYHIFPIKFFEKYTISLSSTVPVEVFLILGEDTDLNMDFIDGREDSIGNKLFHSSYKKYRSIQKKNPVIYDTYEFSSEVRKAIPNYWTHEENLKMVIKIPYWVNTSLTVLEGDYSINTSYLGDTFFPSFIGDISSTDSTPFTRLSLLQNVSTQSFPFADRLVEYLFNLPITKNTIIVNNIGRIQDKVYTREEYKSGFKGYRDIFDSNLKDNLYEIINQPKVITKAGEYKINKIGNFEEPELSNSNYDIDDNTEKDKLSWEDIKVLESAVDENNIPVTKDENRLRYSTLTDRKSDILYWVDKDVEGLVDSL